MAKRLILVWVVLLFGVSWFLQPAVIGAAAWDRPQAGTGGIPPEIAAGWIALEKEGAIYIVHPDGSGLQKLPLSTGTKYFFNFTDWSAGGKYLALVSDFSGNGGARLSVWDASTDQVVSVTDRAYQAQWSPTNDEVLVFSIRDLKPRENYSLWLVDLKNSPAPRQILSSFGGSFDWFPDGNRLLFNTDGQMNQSLCPRSASWLKADGLYELPLSTLQPRQVVPPKTAPFKNVKVSGDGSAVTFGEQYAYCSGWDGMPHPPSKIAHFSQSAVWAEALDETCPWSPTGSLLACGSVNEPASLISILDSSAKIVRQITRLGQITSQTPPKSPGVEVSGWSPDGTWVNGYVVDYAGLSYGGTSTPGYPISFLLPVDPAKPLVLLPAGIQAWSPDSQYTVMWDQATKTSRVYSLATKTYLADLGLPADRAAWQPAPHRPPAAKDLQIFREDPNAFDTFLLVWILAGGREQARQELRYSDQPITAETWSKAAVVPNVPAVDLGRSNYRLSVTIPNYQRKRWYFAIKTFSPDGVESALSNVAASTFLDSGFRRQPNGFSFSNTEATNKSLNISPSWGNDFDQPAHWDFTEADLREMFGDAAVCEPSCLPTGGCKLTATAQAVLEFWNKAMKGGHCYGMAVVAGKLFAGQSDIYRLDQLSGSTYRLSLDQSRKSIAYHHVQQVTEPANTFIPERAKPTLAGFLADVEKGLKDGEPPVIIIQKTDDFWGDAHALLPLAIEDRSSTEKLIWVYDPNYPKNPALDSAWEPRPIKIDLKQGEWSYELDRDKTYSGKEGQPGISAVPLSSNVLHPVFPGQEALPKVQAGLAAGQGGAGLLISNAAGEKIGYDQGKPVNQMKGAFWQALANGPENPAGPLFHLPANAAYTFTIQAGTDAEALRPKLYVIGGGFSITLSRPTLPAQAADRLEVSTDGAQLRFTAGAAGEASLALARESDQKSYRFTLEGLQLAGAGTVAARFDPQSGVLAVTGPSGTASAYSFGVRSVDRGGEYLFSAGGMGLAAGETHLYSVKDWQGGGLEMGVDVNGDGKPETVRRVENSLQAGPPERGWLGVLLIAAGLLALGLAGFLLFRSRRNKPA